MQISKKWTFITIGVIAVCFLIGYNKKDYGKQLPVSLYFTKNHSNWLKELNDKNDQIQFRQIIQKECGVYTQGLFIHKNRIYESGGTYHGSNLRFYLFDKSN